MSQDSRTDPDQAAGSVVMLSGDLMFASRVKAAAAQAGLAFRGTLPDDDCDSIRFVILDLSTRSELTSDIAAQCSERCPQAKLIAYGPHVQVSKLDAARQAGIDSVITNGQFSSRLPQMFGPH